MKPEPVKVITLRESTEIERERANEWWRKHFEQQLPTKGEPLMEITKPVYEIVLTKPGRANVRRIEDGKIIFPSDARRELMEVSCAALNQLKAKENAATPGWK